MNATTAGPIIFEYVDTSVDRVSKVNDFVLKPISASEAFRRYNWLAGSPVLNSSKNLRGMVINSQMRTVYTISEKMGNTLGVISALVEVGREMSRMKAVYGSDASGMEKASRMLLLGSAAILRSVTSVVPTALHLASVSVEGYAQLYSLLTGSPSGNALSAGLDQFDKRIEIIHRKQWDGENWYNVIDATLK